MSMAELPFHFKDKPVIVLMGVCGCGKSTIGKALAESLELPFLEGDDFHPPTHIDKMSRAIPLNDEDRWPWLDRLGIEINRLCTARGGVIISCSALKRSYRARISQAANTPMFFIFLNGTRETLLKRLKSRKNHYMPTTLLDSQLSTVETPEADEAALCISCEQPIDKIINTIQNTIGKIRNHQFKTKSADLNF
ncbi:MAG: gluconokinase [Gammaproteobacteria bacterium]